MSLRRILGLWFPVAAFMGLLSYLSSRQDLEGVPQGWDKMIHLGAYAALGMLSLRAFHGGWRRLGRGPTVAALLLTVLYGLVDELHQSRVDGRHASAWDWVADAAGALMAIPLVALIVALRERWSRRAEHG